ncbi:TPA: hypothetical protein JLG68_001356 [Escherichia coli]|nr:hypothetical protein [Escherichia coli]
MKRVLAVAALLMCGSVQAVQLTSVEARETIKQIVNSSDWVSQSFRCFDGKSFGIVTNHEQGVVIEGVTGAVAVFSHLTFTDTDGIKWKATQRGLVNADESKLCEANDADSVLFDGVLKSLYKGK